MLSLCSQPHMTGDQYYLQSEREIHQVEPCRMLMDEDKNHHHKQVNVAMQGSLLAPVPIALHSQLIYSSIYVAHQEKRGLM